MTSVHGKRDKTRPFKESISRADYLERRLLRWVLYMGGGNLPKETGSFVKMQSSTIVSVYSVLLLGYMVAVEGYSVSNYITKDLVHNVLVLSCCMFRALNTVALILTARKRVRAVAICLSTLEELDVLYGHVEVKGLSGYRTLLLMLSIFVGILLTTIIQLIHLNNSFQNVFFLVIPPAVNEVVLMEHELIFNVLIYKLGVRVYHHSKDLANETNSEAVVDRLRLGCRVQRLVRMRERDLYSSHCCLLVLVLVRVACEFLFTFYIFIGLVTKGSVLGIVEHFRQLAIHFCKFVIIAEPSDRLTHAYRRNVEELNEMLSARGPLLSPACYSEIRHCLSLLDIEDKSTRALGGFFSLRRSSIMPIASFASTYVIVMVQIYQGSI